MISLILLLAAFGILLFWIAVKLTGAFVKGAVWMFLLLPAAVFIMGMALALCATIFLIPLGIKLFRVGWRLLIPG